MSTSEKSTAAPLRIDVWSDVVCPWCYIGKRRLSAALEETGIEATVHWRSFQLDPTAPRIGEPGHGKTTTEMLAERYGGGDEQAQAMQERVSQIAAEEGLDYRLDQARHVNTGDAHRLLHLAASLDETGALQNDLKEALLAAHFTAGRDISDPEVLTELATATGVPAERVSAVLAQGDGEFADAVTHDIETARQYGATGVPFVVLDGRYGVSGAQPVETYVQALRAVTS